MKPNTKKADQSPPVEAPVVEAEAVKDEAQAADTAAESAPDETDDKPPFEVDAAPEVVPDQPEETETEGAAAPAEPVVEAEASQQSVDATTPAKELSFGGAEVVRLGATEALLSRSDPRVVYEGLPPELQQRVDAIRQDERLIRPLQARMRATDGRCAPVVFTAHEGEEPLNVPTVHFFDGADVLAAALNVGNIDVSVIVVENKDASDVQGYLTAKRRDQPVSEEDDFFMRVVAHHEEESPVSST